jgi:hypothetical protein
LSDVPAEKDLSYLESISARLLGGDILGASRLAAPEDAPAQVADLVRLRQLLDQLEGIRRSDGSLRVDAGPAQVFDTLVQVMLGLGAVAEAERLVSEALANWPLDPFLRGALGLVRRAQGRLAVAHELSASAAAEALVLLSLNRGDRSTVHRCELVLDWDAQLRALSGDLSAIGRFAHLRESLADGVPSQRGAPGSPPHINAPALGDVGAARDIAVVEHFGLGDRLMFSRFYSALADRMPSSRITVLCHPLLTSIYRASFASQPSLVFVPTDEFRRGARFDAQLPAPSLPEYFGCLSMDDVKTGPSPSITPSRAAVARVGDRLEALGVRSPTAGLVWRDSLRWYQPHRFVPLAGLAMPLATRGYALVALDPLVDRDEVSMFCESSGTHLITTDDLHIADVDDLAALMVCLDRVVTIDKVFANLGGALGLPTDVLLSTFVDYRWTTGPGGSPFYESVTCYRQANYGNWDEPLQQFASRL